MDKQRCVWVSLDNPLYRRYHDEEWGVPVHDDRVHFEFLVLEGAQAGLSWETILQKREGYRQAFHGFDPFQVAKMQDDALEALLLNPAIVRNRLKVFSARKNAQVFLKIQQEFGCFDTYVWRFVNNQPIISAWQTRQEVPAQTPESDALAKDLKQRGMSFVGSTIVYAYMQAVGLVNDHTTDCWRYLACSAQQQLDPG